MEILELLKPLFSEHIYVMILSILSFLIALAAIIATVLPVPSQNSSLIYQLFYKLCQIAAMNKGKATNQQDFLNKKLQ